MTDEKQKTNVPSEDNPSKPQPSDIPEGPAEAKASQAATLQPAAEQEERTTRSRRTKSTQEPAAARQEPSSRKERRVKKKKDALDETPAESASDEETAVRWVQIRILPIYVRVLLVLLLLAAAVILGALIGYSVLGSGSPGDIFHKETWTHIFDIMTGKQ